MKFKLHLQDLYSDDMPISGINSGREKLLLEKGMDEIYTDLWRISQGEKPYKTKHNLRDEKTGKKLDGYVDIKCGEDGSLREYEIFLDSEIEKDEGKRILTYVHEKIHTIFPEEENEEVIEYLTGKALEYLKSVNNKEVRDLAEKGYEAFLERQIMQYLNDFAQEHHQVMKDMIRRYQESQSRQNRTEWALTIAGDVGNKIEEGLAWMFNNTIGAFLKNYAGVDLKASPGLSKYITDKIKELP
ncbi:hypothetical protein DRJ04_06640 [Candidatus Aerophobetes bacterium]|uniref:Uncharacterized protein n=1 Tax=Aerophobetes bacterium TaxID=2030807 RepID=A0A662D8W8_UNCAE|nr:MAG: hypothetical protein DRJ04_06640 [Candidatus Aerophobetes bacterium]